MPDELAGPERPVLTRRQWLLRLGEATALLGFSGEFENALAYPASPGMAATQASALPPGLYEPSTEHLTHAYRSDGTYHFIPPGSETDYTRPQVEPYRPLFFAPPEFSVVRRIAELLVGESEAISLTARANVAELAQTLAEWIDLSVSSAAGIRRAAEALSPAHLDLAAEVEGKNTFRKLEEYQPEPVCREGLRWLEENSQVRYQQSFIALAADEQLELLHLISDEHPAPQASNPGRRLFDLLKREVIRGFYTSRAGLLELDYRGNSFYAESPGCEG